MPDRLRSGPSTTPAVRASDTSSWSGRGGASPTSSHPRWSPDPRAILPLDRFHVPRRLARAVRGNKFTVTCDRDFGGVIGGCATACGRVGATWLTPRMIRAYIRLFELGHAHSVEAWHEGRLAGGVYGVAIGGFFAAESMFYRESEASKVALVRLVVHLQARGYRLLDIQQLTPHTTRFGAIEIPRRQYLERLAEVIAMPVAFGGQLESLSCTSMKERT